MSGFIDFVKDRTSGPGRALALSQDSVSTSVARDLRQIKLGDAPVFSEPAAQDLANKIGGLAYSEKFLSKFSAAIGKPQNNETEDEFVARCKEKMFSLLTHELK